MTSISETAIQTLVQKLSSEGININLETIKKAIANNPQVVQKIENYLSSTSVQDKKTKILELIKSAAGFETTGSGAGGSSHK